VKKKAFEIPNILQSLRADVDGGKITDQEAAEELCQAGWMNFIDVEKARRLLRIEKGE